MNNPSIDPGVRIGHVHPKVADLERALHFYRDVLGFELQQRLGTQAAFVSARCGSESIGGPGGSGESPPVGDDQSGLSFARGPRGPSGQG